MTVSLAPDHPRQKLLFYVAQEMDDAVRDKVRRIIVQLADLRHWVNGPPRLFRSREETTELSPEDIATETIGGFVEIYSAYPPWTLPPEIDAQHFDEVSALVEALREFSRQFGLAFELELDGKFVGSIIDGEMDRSLSDGLLGAWRRHLNL